MITANSTQISCASYSYYSKILTALSRISDVILSRSSRSLWMDLRFRLTTLSIASSSRSFVYVKSCGRGAAITQHQFTITTLNDMI